MARILAFLWMTWAMLFSPRPYRITYTDRDGTRRTARTRDLESLSVFVSIADDLTEVEFTHEVQP